MAILRKHRVVSKGGGVFEICSLDLPAGEELELVELNEADDLTYAGMLLAEPSLSKFWDDPAEDVWDSHPPAT